MKKKNQINKFPLKIYMNVEGKTIHQSRRNHYNRTKAETKLLKRPQNSKNSNTTFQNKTQIIIKMKDLHGQKCLEQVETITQQNQNETKVIKRTRFC